MLDTNSKNLLICAKCQELSVEPHECESCSQLYCKSHIPPMCIRCLTSHKFRYSLVAKKIISELEVPCPYCNQNFKHAHLYELHLNSCSNLILSCKVKHCHYTGNKISFVEHVIVYHPNEILDFFTQRNEKDIEALPHVISIEEYKRKYDSDVNTNINKSSINSSNITSVPNVLNLRWIGGSKIFVKTKKGHNKFLISSMESFTEGIFSVKFGPSLNYNYLMIGFTSRQYNGEELYIGGNSGKGDWGVAGNGMIGFENKWNKDYNNVLRFTQNLIQLSFINGKITVTIDGQPNNYMYFLGSNRAYLSACLFSEGDSCMIL